MVKIDPYKHKEKFFNWKERIESGIPDISKDNSDLIKNYIFDMEKGLNIGSGTKKGSRSYIRLNTLRDKLTFFAKKFEEMYNVSLISEIKEEQVCEFFTSMSNGKIKKKNNQLYKTTPEFVKDFKSFWHWWMKINRKKGIEIKDITIDLDMKRDKPKWVYLNEDQVKKLCEGVRHEYKILIMFLIDSGIRSPTELINIKVSDLYNDFKELNIRDEISKTFGRRIKLMLCSDLIKDYIKDKKLKPDDQLFKISPPVVNKYLKRISKKILGDELSLAGQKYSEISMYDFRHISCCYWLPRYKSESALKYRFGWIRSEKIHYYSEFLGMKDTISEEDLLIDITKTEIEKRLTKTERDKEVLQEKVKVLENQIVEIRSEINKVFKQVEEKVKSNGNNLL